MNSQIHTLSELCYSDQTITESLINWLDQLELSIQSSFDPDKNAASRVVWEVIQRSHRFWDNVSLLLLSNSSNRTKLQTFITMHKKIKTRWFLETQEMQLSIKTSLCNIAQHQIKGIQSTNPLIYRKVNQMIGEILKYEWAGEWNNYLEEIAESIYNNESLAQNYFDLLDIIFTQIFSQENMLTHNEKKQIKEQIVNSYTNVSRCFEKYLIIQTPDEVLRNCLSSMQSIFQWIPSYYIFYGLIIDKLLDLLQKTRHKVEICRTLSHILTLEIVESSEEITSNFYSKKRKILISILNLNLNFSILPEKDLLSLFSIVFSSALTFLEQQSGYFQIYRNQQKKSMEAVEENELILLRLSDWIPIYYQRCGQPEERPWVIGLYSFIFESSFVEKIVQFVPTIVQLAPCPFNINFYTQNNIIKSQSLNLVTREEEDIERYKKIISIVISRYNQQFLEFLIVSLVAKIDFFLNSQNHIYFAKVIWSFYQWLTYIPENLNAKNAILAFINNLVQIQEKLEHIYVVDHPTSYHNILKLKYSIKIGLYLILSHKATIVLNICLEPLYMYFERGLSESITFIKGVFSIMQINYDLMEQKEKFHERYRRAMANKINRVQIDLLYIKMVLKWNSLKQVKKDKSFAVNVCIQILNLYEKQVQKIRKLSISTKDIQQLQTNRLPHKIIPPLFNFMRVLSSLLPHRDVKELVINKVESNYKFIKTSLSMISFTKQGNSYEQYFRYALEVLFNYYKYLNRQEINYRAQIIFSNGFELINYFFSSISKDQPICQENLETILKFCTTFIEQVLIINVKSENKAESITKIIEKVLNMNFSLSNKGYSDFIFEIVRCKNDIINILPFPLFSRVIAQIFLISSQQSDHLILKSIEMFKAILAKALQAQSKDSNANHFIFQCILDFIVNLYLIMVRLKQRINYVEQFSEVFFMALYFVRNRVYPFVANQEGSNMEIIERQLIDATQNHFKNMREKFIEKIKQYINFLLQVKEKQEFNLKMRDLIVILRRGY